MKTNRKTKEQPLPFHFYASTYLHWGTGPTREHVLAELAKRHEDTLTAAAVKKHGGIEVAIMRVELPQEATYTIRDYVPNEITKRNEQGELTGTGKRVPLRQYERLLLVDRKGTAIANPDAPRNPTDEELAAEDNLPPRRYW